MGRREGPLAPDSGPVEAFAAALRQARAAAGSPTYRAMAARANYSPSSLSSAAAGHRLASWPVVAGYLRACGVTEVEPWRARWRAVAGGAAAGTTAGARAERPAAAVGRLPGETTSFVGRQPELDDVTRHLLRSRLVVLTGTGGVGKSRLALRAAALNRDSYPDGVWWIELADTTDPQVLAHTLLRALGVPSDSTGAPSVRLVEALADRRALLVLDNCEHLVDACARAVRTLLGGTSAVAVLATSRQCLGLPEETVVPIGPLSFRSAGSVAPFPADRGDGPSPAVRLLVDRAETAAPGLGWPPEQLALAEEVCAQLEGLPLAIELAARRLRVMSLHQLSRRLGDRHALLSNGDRTVHPRHRSLQALLDWSYELCDPAERALWCRLSVFAGDVSLEAAEEMGADGAADTGASDSGAADAGALDVVTALVERSVLTSDGDRTAVRLRMLESVREYGLARLRAAGAEDAARARHRAWYARFAERVASAAHGPDQRTALARTRAEYPNLRAALSSALTLPDGGATAQRMATALWFYWHTEAVDEGCHWLDAALARRGGPAAVRAEALWTGAYLAAMCGDNGRALRYAERSLRLVGDTPGPAAGPRLVQGLAALRSSRAADALRLSQLAEQGFLARDDAFGVQQAVSQAAMAHLLLGDTGPALATFRRAAAVAHAHGEQWHLSYVLWGIGMVRHAQGRTAQALAGFRRSLTVKRLFQDTRGTATVLETTAWVLADLGNPEAAAHLVGAAASIWPEPGRRLFGFADLLAAGDRNHHRLRAVLGPDRLARALAHGRTLDAEGAVALALAAPVPGTPPPGPEDDRLPAPVRA
ncbi:AAA family ATPase [Kitasatospora sp. NPDC002551]|uniref:ATP-binding protein n=1 Tax=Kitasatospora sp. NPDC002551 TaxID=3154539 RepID=UPI00332F0915